MKLSKEAIADFKKIYLEKRGVELSDEEADTMGWELLELMDLLLRPTQPKS
jgi:hypothetical protein